jgi:hypothetical protein
MKMMSSVVGYVLSASVLATIWLMGCKAKWRHIGYALGFFSQLLWVYYVVALVPQPPLLLMEIPLVGIYGRHLWKGD